LRIIECHRAGLGRADGVSSVWLCAPALGGLIVGLLLRFTRERRAENISDVISVVQIGEKSFCWRDGLINAFAAIIGMGSGASVGPYGSLTTLGAHLGDIFKKHTRAELNLAAGCGVAAMISTAFTAPIAAVIFVHEVVLRHYALRSLLPSLSLLQPVILSAHTG